MSPSYVLDKLSRYSRRKHETDRRRVAERELDILNLKIGKLLLRMGDTEAPNQNRLSLEEECVVCLAAPATMQTFPCGHKVVCRKCLIKTIQVAVSQRCLPLRCVICRDRILRLQHTAHHQSSMFGSNVLQASSLPATFIPSMPHGRILTSPLPPASPTFFSFITGSKTSSLRFSFPVGAGILGAHSPTSLASSPDGVPKLSHLTQASFDNEFMRYAPTDIEAFVNSHNDALNLHTPDENKAGHKCGRQRQVLARAKSEVSSHNVAQCQSAKIYPATTDHIASFMESPAPTTAHPATHSATNMTRKPVKASKFFARFLPTKSQNKYN